MRGDALSEIDDLLKRARDIDEMVVDRHTETQRWLREAVTVLLLRERQRVIVSLPQEACETREGS